MASEHSNNSRGASAGGEDTARRKARIALVGTGWWATYTHLPALAGRPDVELVALANRGAEKLRLAAEAFPAHSTYTDYREMLDREALDGVVVATSHTAHYEITKAALEHDCHVLVEKPLVLKTYEARELIETAQRRGKAIVMSYPWGYTAHVRRAREVALGGELGEVQLLSSLFTSFAYETYRGDPETLDRIFDGTVFAAPVVRPRYDANTSTALGGGQGYCQLTHSAALAFWITGLCARQVSAYMECLDVTVDVVDAISVRLSNGALGVLASTGNLQPGDRGQHTLWVYGSRGYLILDLIAGTLLIHRTDAAMEALPPLPPDERYPRFAPTHNFVDVILGRAENLAPGEIGRTAVSFLDAAYRSAARGGVPTDVCD